MFFKKKTAEESYESAFNHYKQKQYRSALKHISNALNKNPNNHRFLILRANIYEDGISKEKALLDYKKAWEIEKHYSTAFRIGYSLMFVNPNPLIAATWCYTSLTLYKSQRGDTQPLMSVPLNTILYNIGFYLIHIKDQYTIGYAMEFIRKAALAGHSKAELLNNAIAQGDYHSLQSYFPTIFEAYDTDLYIKYKMPIGSELKPFI